MMVRLKRVQPTPKRSGQSLLLMFFIILMLLGVMALTLDFGFVLLARRQMQTGVNTAAMEGLRGQGLTTHDSNGEELRRENAREMLRLNFDDDFDLSANNTTIGAGIDSSLIQGNGFRQTTIGPADTTLAEDLANRSSFIFRPDNFELNEDNEAYGDMVVGTYDPATATAHTESSDYSRSDFTATTTNPASFLIRMRRTHNPGGLDEVPGVSSRGGGLPLLLGRAGWFQAESPAADYSIRRDGVLVRATAIANVVPARSVGVADLTINPPLIGLAPLAIETAGWQSLTTDTPYSLNTDNGELTNATTVLTTTRRITAAEAAFVGNVLSETELTWPASNLISDRTTATLYVPIVAPLSSTTTTVSETLIVGFASINLSRSDTTYTLTPLGQNVGVENASAIPGTGWLATARTELATHNTDFAGLPAAQQTAVFGELIEQAFAASTELTRQNSLLAPSLARTIR